jgi:hypothetical protein
MITLKDARAFCNWLQRKTGRKITLPTEAQWEFACRAGSSSRFYSGDSDADADEIAWTKNNADNATHPVGQKKANEWGLYDMSGNVYQWCSDVYGPYRRGGPVEGDLDKPRNVLRGGSWLKGINDARSAARYRNTPGSRNADNGFRIVAEIKPPPAIEPASGSERPQVVAPIEAPEVGPMVRPPTIPVTPAAPVPAAPTFTPRSSLPTFFGCAFFAVLAGIIITIIVMVIRAFRGNAGPQLPSAVPPPLPPQNRPPTIRPRVSDDGFFIDTTGYNPGDVLVYSYDTPDGQIVQQYTVDQPIPGQFIYTGVRPANLMFQALGVAAGLAAQRHHYQQQQYTPPPPPPPRPRPRQERSFSGFPSAY